MNLPTLNPTQNEFETMQRQCKMAILSGFLPSAYNSGGEQQQMAKACMIAMKGRELGVPMMQAFSQINIIQGKPSISAELMLSLIYRSHPKAEIHFEVYTNEECRITAARPGSKSTTFTFTMADAKKAGLLKPGGNWDKYPRAMLRSRCISEMARTIFPDAIMGCSYTPEELGQELPPEEGEKDVTPIERTDSELSRGAIVPEPDSVIEPQPEEIAEPDFEPPKDIERAAPEQQSDLSGLPNFAPGAGQVPESMPPPEQPKSQPASNEQLKEAEKLAQFRLTTGKYKGKTLGEIDRNELFSWIQYSKEKGWYTKLLPICEKWLELCVLLPPPQNDDEEFPW